jgi:hypothetical protein
VGLFNSEYRWCVFWMDLFGLLVNFSYGPDLRKSHWSRSALPEEPVEGRGRHQGESGLPCHRGGSARQRRRGENRSFESEGTGIVVFSCIMYFGGRVKRSKKVLDDGNNPPFIIRYR